MGGLMSITGQPDGEPGAGPMKVGVALTDILTGLYASTSILAALQARHQTGRGQHIDLALLDVGVACLANQAMNYLHSGQAPKRMGNAHPNTVPYQDFPSADGHMILAIGNDAQFARFCKAAGHPDLASDIRFSTNQARLSNRRDLIAQLRDITRTRTTAEWIDLLELVSVPCGPINTIANVFADPQVQARGMQMQMDHPTTGSIDLVASPIRLSDTPVRYHRAPPVLGQDTREVLKDYLNMTELTMNELFAQGVLA
jgi:crotonobetainyl-CoA:carnitine CoA-transferase CaiB-like acyl-CoA transferase